MMQHCMLLLKLMDQCTWLVTARSTFVKFPCVFCAFVGKEGGGGGGHYAPVPSDTDYIQKYYASFKQ